MSKKVLIISTSLRNNSNSEILAKELEKGAKEAGNDVCFISLKDKEIKFCKGCLACQKTGSCIIKDDANTITEKIKNSDVIVWATPVYYYEMSGQMKTLIDRANSLYTADYKFREVYLITTAADEAQEAAEPVKNGLKGWLACLNKAKFSGCICGGSLENPADVNQQTELMKRAFEAGKNI